MATREQIRLGPGPHRFPITRYDEFGEEQPLPQGYSQTGEGAPAFRGSTGIDPFLDDEMEGPGPHRFPIDDTRGEDIPLDLPEDLDLPQDQPEEIDPLVSSPGQLHQEASTEFPEDIFEGGTIEELERGTVQYPRIEEGEFSRENIRKTDPALYKQLFGEDIDDLDISSAAKLRIVEAGLEAYVRAGGKDQTKIDRLTTIRAAKVRVDSFGNKMKPVPPRVNGVPSLEERAMVEEKLFQSTGGNPYLRNPKTELDRYWAANQRTFFTHTTGARWEDANKLSSKQRSEYLSRFAQVSRQIEDRIKADIDQKKQMVSIGLTQFDRTRNEALARAKELRKDAPKPPKAITRRTVQQGSNELRKHYTDNISKIEDKARIGVSSKWYNSIIQRPGMTAAIAIEIVKKQTEKVVTDYWNNRDRIQKLDRKARNIKRKQLDDGFRRIYGTIPITR